MVSKAEPELLDPLERRVEVVGGVLQRAVLGLDGLSARESRDGYLRERRVDAAVVVAVQQVVGALGVGSQLVHRVVLVDFHVYHVLAGERCRKSRLDIVVVWLDDHCRRVFVVQTDGVGAVLRGAVCSAQKPEVVRKTPVAVVRELSAVLDVVAVRGAVSFGDDLPRAPLLDHVGGGVYAEFVRTGEPEFLADLVVVHCECRYDRLDPVCYGVRDLGGGVESVL